MDLGSPFGYPLQTYIWVVGLACSAGAIKYINQISSKGNFALIALIKDILTGGLSGLMSFWLCEGLGVKPPMNAVIIAITGIMGSRAWEEFENIFKGLLVIASSKKQENQKESKKENE